MNNELFKRLARRPIVCRPANNH